MVSDKTMPFWGEHNLCRPMPELAHFLVPSGRESRREWPEPQISWDRLQGRGSAGAHGVTGNKALHQLRKEAGSLIASRDGIFAASAFLRHHDISVTHAFYADKKTRTAIDVGELLRAPDERPGKVIELRRGVTQEKRREGPNEQEH